MAKAWRCPWCGHGNDGSYQHYCTECWNGRTQAIENSVRDKNGIARSTLRKRSGT